MTGKVGGVAGSILGFVIQIIGSKLADYVSDLYKKYQRKKEQEEALKKVEQDVQSKAPRTDEVRRNEKNFLNS